MASTRVALSFLFPAGSEARDHPSGVFSEADADGDGNGNHGAQDCERLDPRTAQWRLRNEFGNAVEGVIDAMPTGTTRSIARLLHRKSNIATAGCG